ncbi:HepT-like ribonuclease domain-containing protein [Nodosilinea sp. P-1105]|uniref:HepT-like ribonuclease domain-containing protein n=1 Tax=Nodosilinea sp. P-1105 TaxID=2546229 RepID=UPI00146C006D|nr:HepT-like ribonuclease domain-containing protein [Nodosilinea sp. P-1105]NMF86024.1 hypothetical protein [Nodosilinea sp. P-1105]
MNHDLGSLLILQQTAQLSHDQLRACSQDDFDHHIRLQATVTHHLLTVAAIARQLPEATKQQVAAVDWVKLQNLRDSLVDDADNLQPDRAWQCVQTDISALLATLSPYLPPN